MKKNIKIYLFFIIIIIVGLLTNNAIISLFLYNQNFNYTFLSISNIDLLGSNYLNEFLPFFSSFLVFGITGIITFVCTSVFKRISKNILKEVEEGKKKRIKTLLIIMLLVVFIVSDIFLFLGYNKYAKDFYETFHRWSYTYNLDASDGYFYLFGTFLNVPEVSKLQFVVLIVSIIPTIVSFGNLFKYKEKSKKRKIFSNSILSFFIILFMIGNICYYIDIPEFSYTYIVYDSEVHLLAYSDNRKMLYSDEFVFPDKIANMNIKGMFLRTFLYPEKKIILPSTLKWNEFFCENSIITLYNNEIIMVGEPIEWIVEDNVVYNKDKTEMILIEKNMEKLYIPDKIKKIINYGFIFTLKNTEIEVGKENEHFYEYDNVLYIKDFNTIAEEDEEITNVDALDITLGLVTANTKSIRIMDLPNNKITLLGDIECETLKIILPSTMQKGFDYINVCTNSNQIFDVEEGNQFFVYENGILYNKDKSQIIEVHSGE